VGLVEWTGNDENHSSDHQQVVGMAVVEVAPLEVEIGVEEGVTSSVEESARQGELKNIRIRTLEQRFFGTGASALSSRTSPSSGMNGRFF
jgi:hypothetical protein